MQDAFERAFVRWRRIARYDGSNDDNSGHASGDDTSGSGNSGSGHGGSHSDDD